MSRHCRHVGLCLGRRHCHMVSSRFLFLLTYLSGHNQTLKKQLTCIVSPLLWPPKCSKIEPSLIYGSSSTIQSNWNALFRGLSGPEPKDLGCFVVHQSLTAFKQANFCTHRAVAVKDVRGELSVFSVASSRVLIQLQTEKESENPPRVRA